MPVVVQCCAQRENLTRCLQDSLRTLTVQAQRSLIFVIKCRNTTSVSINFSSDTFGHTSAGREGVKVLLKICAAVVNDLIISAIITLCRHQVARSKKKIKVGSNLLWSPLHYSRPCVQILYSCVWAAVIASCSAVLYGTVGMAGSSQSVTSMYLAVRHVVLGAGVAWLVFACSTNNASTLPFSFTLLA